MPIPVTPTGTEQVSPDTKQEYQCYEVLQHTGEVRATLVKVLLIKDLEVLVPLTRSTYLLAGYGKAGDIIEVMSHIARNSLFLGGHAVYASDFNLQKYGFSEKASETAAGSDLSFMNRTSRHLHQMVLNITMNMTVPWTVEKWHVRVSFRKSGLMLKDDCVILPPEPINGPDFAIESKLFRFYVVINRKVVVPCTGRVHHVTLDTTKKIISPGFDPYRITNKQISESGLVKEEIYFADDLNEMNDKQVWDLMVSRRAKQ
ncbi:unnamed protein product [Soboliphyme baturini]|uniref:Large ribosomal subunit protein bL9m n=1 Tax=Soboliphyme baturini TaxID=241478 RepID=A0A183IC51_9BILA|nr:unnamed protein product [Soboliphyme baturini]